MASDQSARGNGSTGVVIAFLSVYGALLCACGLVLAGGGHGTYILLGLAGSPFSLFGMRSMVAASLTQWVVLALAATLLHCSRYFIAAYLVIHYAVAIYVLSFSLTWRDEWYAPHSNVLLVIGIAGYVAGQVFMWRRLVLGSHRLQQS